MSTPGERITALERDLHNADSDIAELKSALKALSDRTAAIERFQQWFVGAAAVVGFLFGVFSSEIKKRLGLS